MRILLLKSAHELTYVYTIYTIMDDGSSYFSGNGRWVDIPPRVHDTSLAHGKKHVKDWWLNKYRYCIDATIAEEFTSPDEYNTWTSSSPELYL